MNDPQTKKALDYAIRLLSHRARSRGEILQRLTMKKYPADVMEKVLEALEGFRYIDDRAFARQWIESRLAQSKGPRIITR